ncbi:MULTISPECIES: prephenate dehydrogenase [unclassified Streptococcus]|uniref:prephenate dehydrogenase n=1 Tax=unclassified Streptococcus TaxID=2608887 RepID=UPI0015B79976|nr:MULTISPECIES: prephenate dehydrogenase [unclassified Streptococcus]MCP9014986.1 prephenate dehydrogenase [Streptococcus sp. CF8_St5-17]QLF55895.1 prephenate dehydrogenase [Streptococcus sp. oral taxon 061]
MAKTIYIAGLGLIGASMALGIKRDHPDYEILGYNRSQASRDIALERGMIDRATDNFASFAPLADIIILSLPIQQTLDFIEKLASLDLKEGVIISDAGSTKSAIVATADKCFADKPVRFVGAHPMAGSHKTGAASADVNLFENAYYIFTPSSLTTQDTLEEMKGLLSGLHARFIEIDATEHDRVTSQISHFPHILASGLMEQTASYAEEHEMARRFAAGGFRDMTRIAESEPGMWTSILLSNRETIIERIEDFKGRLDEIEQAISKGDENQIWNFFNQAREQRQAMEIHKRGGVDSSYDLYVDVPDEEDVILRILELLRGTSLVNIHINEENREDVHGILQISFKNAQDLKRAEQVITENTDYTVVIK